MCSSALRGILWLCGIELPPRNSCQSNHGGGATSQQIPYYVSRSSALAEVETMTLKEWHTFLDDLEDNNKKIFRAESGFLPFARACKTLDFMKLRPPKWFKKINRSSMSTLTQMCTNHAPTGEYFKRCVWKYQNKPPSFFFCPCHKSKDHHYPPVLQTRDHII